MRTISESALFLPSKLIFFTNFCGTVLEMRYYIRARVSNRACTVVMYSQTEKNPFQNSESLTGPPLHFINCFFLKDVFKEGNLSTIEGDVRSCEFDIFGRP